VKDCILYVVWNLRHSGFKVLYVSPNRLLISWKEQSIQYYQEDSPIRQAMLATATATAAPVKVAPATNEKKKTANYRPAPDGVAAMLVGGTGGAKRSSNSAGKTITFI
jgi:hypothetical protein